MGTVNKPYGDIANGTTSDANVVDQQLNTLYTLVNGNIDDNNVKAGTISKGVASEGVLPSQTKGIPYATDLFNSPFIFSGGVPTKDGTTLNQINVPAYAAYATQPDGTLRRITTAATTKQVSTPSSTYYLDLNPDATFTWGGHSTQANYLTICTVTSDASGNVATITDTRSTQVNVLGGAIGYKTFGDINDMYGMRNLLDPSKQSFTRASNATRKDLTPVPFNVLRTEQGKFGQGAFIEESTQQLVNNSDFETITGTATVFSDAMTAGTTADPAWTTQSGSFTWSTSGATSGANGSILTAGNNAWKPLTGSNGTALSLTLQATFTTPATLSTGVNGQVLLFQSSGNNYVTYISNTSFYIGKNVNNVYTALTSVAQTISASATYTVTLAIAPNGGLTAKLYSGQGTGGTLLQTLTATDTSLTGGFLIGCGGDTNVVVSHSQVTAPFADGWSTGGDLRVAWALTSNAISGNYSVSAVGVTSVKGTVKSNTVTASASTTYYFSGALNTSSVGTLGANFELDWVGGTGTLSTTVITGTNNAQRFNNGGSSPTGTTGFNVYCVMNDSGTAVFDCIQAEQKAYPTTYVRNDSTSASATRNADSLSYMLSNPLPSQNFGALVWTPEQGSATITRNVRLITFFDKIGNNAYQIYYYASGKYLTFYKFNSNASLNSSSLTFNALDSLFIAWKDDPTGSGLMTLWVGINGGALSTFTLANTTSVSNAQVVYVGTTNSTTYECNGTIDYPIITDTIPTIDQVQALYQASDWGGTRHWPMIFGTDQQAWIAPTLLNGWTNYNGGYNPVGYIKDSLGFTRLRGYINAGTVTSGTTLFNLPVGYRPMNTVSIPIISNASGTVTPGTIEITNAGVVKIGPWNLGSSFLTLDNASFRAEQ